MTKFLAYFLIYLLGIVIQFAFAKHAAIFGLFPNILLLGLLFIGLKRGSLAGQTLGFAWGITWDVLAVDLFGSHALLFTLIGYLSGKFARKLDESKVVTQMTIAGFGSIFFWIGMDLTRMIFGDTVTVLRFDYITMLQIPYNMILAPLIFGIGRYVNFYFRSREKGSSFHNG
jgi:rod shape-determining protein MreD